tara:strand:- start:1006 stop:1383 length:378 start_codon:yes stop_codon:yes gene_type:complete
MDQMNKMMEMFDMKQIADMWKVENLKEMSEKNLAKCKEASEVLMEGMNTFSKRQAELTKESVEANIASVKEVASSKTVEEFVAKQHNAAEAWGERNVAAAKELAEIAKVSQDKASEIIKEMAKVK